MAENRHHDPRQEHDISLPDLSNPDQRHETKDVNVWAIGKFAIALVILAFFTIGLMAGMFQYLLHREGGNPSRIESPATDARQLPPEPRLEETPIGDLLEMRAAEDKVLSSYAWVDQQNGIVRIPISRAIELLAQRGLPSRPQTEPQSVSGTVSVPVESGMGEVMTQPGGPLANQPVAAAPAAAAKPLVPRKPGGNQ
jgi:hypothetical protein